MSDTDAQSMSRSIDSYGSKGMSAFMVTASQGIIADATLIPVRIAGQLYSLLIWAVGSIC